MLFFERKLEKRPEIDDSEKLKEFLNEPSYQRAPESPYPDIDALTANDEPDIEFPLAKAQKIPPVKSAELPKKEDDYRLPDEVEIVEKTVEPVSVQRTARKEGSAPLFVKVDKYNDILDSLQQTRALISGIKPVFNLLAEVEGVRKEALESLRITIQKIEKNVTILDSEMSRPGEPIIGASQMSNQDARHVETSLNQLQNNLSSLKSELERMK